MIPYTNKMIWEQQQGFLAGVENKCALIRAGHREIDEEIDNRFLHLFGSTHFSCAVFPPASPLQSLQRLRYSTLENSSVVLA